jgi:hypothetical protein
VTYKGRHTDGGLSQSSTLHALSCVGIVPMLSKPVLPLLIAALIATLLAAFSDRRGFEELTARAAIADQASALGTKCPLSKEYIDTAEIGLLSICLKYGLAAYEGLLLRKARFV